MTPIASAVVPIQKLSGLRSPWINPTRCNCLNNMTMHKPNNNTVDSPSFPRWSFSCCRVGPRRDIAKTATCVGSSATCFGLCICVCCFRCCFRAMISMTDSGRNLDENDGGVVFVVGDGVVVVVVVVDLLRCASWTRIAPGRPPQR